MTAPDPYQPPRRRCLGTKKTDVINRTDVGVLAGLTVAALLLRLRL